MIITGAPACVFTAGDDSDEFPEKADTSRPETLSDGAKFLYSPGAQLKAKPDHRGRGPRVHRHMGHRDAVTFATTCRPQRRDLLGAPTKYGLVRSAPDSLLMPRTMGVGYQRLCHAGDGTDLQRRRGPARGLRQHRGLAGTHRGRGPQASKVAREICGAVRGSRDSRTCWRAARAPRRAQRRIDRKAIGSASAAAEKRAELNCLMLKSDEAVARSTRARTGERKERNGKALRH